MTPTAIQYFNYRVEPHGDEWEIVCDYEVTTPERPDEDRFQSVCRVALVYSESDATYIADRLNFRERFGF